MLMLWSKLLNASSMALLASVGFLVLIAAPEANADRGYDRYGLSIGLSVTHLPKNYRSIRYRGNRYYTHGGHFYQAFGSGYSVVAAPLGYRTSLLSHRHDSFFDGSSRYSRFHNDHYQWSPRFGAYVVVERPGSTRHYSGGPSVFASSGQNNDQREGDKVECRALAEAKTGVSSAEAARTYEYEPVFRGCLEKRGYTVR